MDNVCVDYIIIIPVKQHLYLLFLRIHFIVMIVLLLRRSGDSLGENAATMPVPKG